ncbi:hypothetical protein EUGRSUZ_E01654 [Eucalyptus grandis]|uniref:PGG domain-containing protein n=2 Tax=Eucalyptus grandis TaxID=71139 RepID=A0A059C4A1_EUCGR|nr:hypothetical protein EUGRSUZ_E01654 [Eucalyptus grandis]
MDPRLLKAAQKGDMGLLKDLIRSNELILEEAALQGAGHTPLHVACVAGHSNFVRELLKLMPKLAEKVSPDGFSPLHIAAARGDVETVREILKAGRPQRLCHVKGRERRIPLHYAAASGEVGATKILLSASPESVEETTVQEQTALHLSVKNNRFDTFVVLVEHLKQHKKEQVVDFMLSGHTLQREVMEVNALNESGSTPLDVSSPSDPEIREILVRAGAIHGQSNLPSSQIKRDASYQSRNEPAVKNDHPPAKDSNQGQESLGNIRSDLLVVAVLIAGATYNAVLQPPTFPRKARTHGKEGSLEAFFNMDTKFAVNLSLFCFLSSNTFGFLLSVLIINRLAADFPLKLLLRLSTLYMVLTYYILTVLVPSRSLEVEDYSPLGARYIVAPTILIPVALLLLIIWVQNKIEPGFCKKICLP